MKKLLIVALLALLPTAFLTSCKSDDNKKEQPASEAIAGVYNGNLTITMTPGEGMPASPAVIEIASTTETTVKLTLKESAFDALLGGEKIVVDNIAVVKSGSEYTMTGTGSVSMGGQALPITISGTGSKAKMKITIGVNMGVLQVSAVFDGAVK